MDSGLSKKWLSDTVDLGAWDSSVLLGQREETIFEKDFKKLMYQHLPSLKIETPEKFKPVTNVKNINVDNGKTSTSLFWVKNINVYTTPILTLTRLKMGNN